MLILTTRGGMLYDIDSGVLITENGSIVPAAIDGECVICETPTDFLSHQVCLACILKSEEIVSERAKASEIHSSLLVSVIAISKEWERRHSNSPAPPNSSNGPQCYEDDL